MKRTRYKKEKAGKWIQPIRRGYLMACCDCGLVHRMDFKFSNGHVQFRAWRSRNKTAALRRETGIKVTV